MVVVGAVLGAFGLGVSVGRKQLQRGLAVPRSFNHGTSHPAKLWRRGLEAERLVADALREVRSAELPADALEETLAGLAAERASIDRQLVAASRLPYRRRRPVLDGLRPQVEALEQVAMRSVQLASSMLARGPGVERLHAELEALEQARREVEG